MKAFDKHYRLNRGYEDEFTGDKYLFDYTVEYFSPDDEFEIEVVNVRDKYGTKIAVNPYLYEELHLTACNDYLDSL